MSDHSTSVSFVLHAETDRDVHIWLITFLSASQRDRWTTMTNLVPAWWSRKVFVCSHPPLFAENRLFKCDCCKKMGSSTLLMEWSVIFHSLALYTHKHTRVSHIHIYTDNNHWHMWVTHTSVALTWSRCNLLHRQAALIEHSRLAVSIFVKLSLMSGTDCWLVYFFLCSSLWHDFVLYSFFFFSHSNLFHISRSPSLCHTV